jgi:hypothetical protein
LAVVRTSGFEQNFDIAFRTHLKNRILVQDRGGAKFLTGGIRLYVEDLKRGTNKEIYPPLADWAKRHF